MYCSELESKTALFIAGPRAGHTHPAISCFTEIKLIRLSIILKNIDVLKKKKTIPKSYCKSTLGMCPFYQKYSKRSILVFSSILSEVFAVVQRK